MPSLKMTTHQNIGCLSCQKDYGKFIWDCLSLR